VGSSPGACTRHAPRTAKSEEDPGCKTPTPPLRPTRRLLSTGCGWFPRRHSGSPKGLLAAWDGHLARFAEHMREGLLAASACAPRGPSPDPEQARAELDALARGLARKRPGAAASLREGLAETLTVNRLGVGGKLLQTVGSTNPVESRIEIVRDHAGRVKRWSSGEMALRWAAAGMLAAQAQFRRVKGYQELPHWPPRSNARPLTSPAGRPGCHRLTV
jgi:hypothetical protein